MRSCSARWLADGCKWKDHLRKFKPGSTTCPQPAPYLGGLPAAPALSPAFSWKMEGMNGGADSGAPRSGSVYRNGYDRAHISFYFTNHFKTFSIRLDLAGMVNAGDESNIDAPGDRFQVNKLFP